jgi:hypothetical protein
VESASGELRTGTAPAEEHLSLLPDLLPGLEWGEAVSLVHDLDVDMEEVAAGARESV